MKRTLLSLLIASTLGAQDATRWIDHVTPTFEPFETYVIITNFLGSPCEITFKPYDRTGHQLQDVPFALEPFQTIKQKSDDVFGADAVSHFQIVGSSFCHVTIGYQLYEGQGATAHVAESPDRYTDFIIYPGEPEYIFDGMAAVNYGFFPTRITAIVRDASGATLQELLLHDGLEPRHKGLWLLNDFVDENTASIAIKSSEPIGVTLLRGTRPDIVPGYLFEVSPIGEPNTSFKEED